MTNWEIYINELVDCSVLSYRNQYDNIVNEITKCFCFGFISLERRYELLSYLEDAKRKQEYEDKVFHEQRLFEIRLNQEKILREKEMKELLKLADDEYRKKFEKKGRGRPKKIVKKIAE